MLPGIAQLSSPIDGPKDCPSKISSTAEKCARHTEVEELAGPGRGTSFAQRDLLTTPDSYHAVYVSIDALPDELLLGIFYFICVHGHYKMGCEPKWKTLVHVCRRWRYLVFAAPRRLDLRLFFAERTPVVRALDVWPALPIVVDASDPQVWFPDNLIAAFKHNDRISEIYIAWLTSSGWRTLGRLIQGPYPALTALHIHSHDTVYPPHISDSFLRGSKSAPHLRSLRLHGVEFPALPKLLLSSTGLVCLSLWNILPPSYFSAEAMADYLSSLMGLGNLRIDFTCCRPGPTCRRSPLTRTVLPVLYSFSFRGLIEHLEYFDARIEAPRLKYIYLEFYDPVIFGIPTISLSIGSKELFSLRALDQAHMLLTPFTVEITLSSRNGTIGGRSFMLAFMCNDSGWRLQSLTQDHRPFPPRSRVAKFGLFDLPLKDQNSRRQIRTIGNARWLELLRFFTSVENLYLSEGVAVFVVPAMQELAAREGVATQVLPALQKMFIEEHWFSKTPREKAFEFEEFFAAREVSGYPVSLQRWV